MKLYSDARMCYAVLMSINDKCRHGKKENNAMMNRHRPIQTFHKIYSMRSPAQLDMHPVMLQSLLRPLTCL